MRPSGTTPPIGGWRSSPYYLAELPAWVEDFNARRDLDAYLGTVWAPLPVDAATLEELAIERVDLGPLAATFPHPFGGLQPAADPTFYAALTVSPWLDVYLARFAEHLIETQGLGGDAHSRRPRARLFVARLGRTPVRPEQPRGARHRAAPRPHPRRTSRLRGSPGRARPRGGRG